MSKQLSNLTFKGLQEAFTANTMIFNTTTMRSPLSAGSIYLSGWIMCLFLIVSHVELYKKGHMGPGWSNTLQVKCQRGSSVK